MTLSECMLRTYIETAYCFADDGIERNVRIAYTAIGSPQRDNGEIVNAVLLLHGTVDDASQFTSDPDALFAPGAPLDYRRFYTIVPDALGHGDSSKPSDEPTAVFPHYGYRDCVALQERLLDTLGVARALAVIGTSMGGMLAWLWATQTTLRARSIVAIACEPLPVRGRNLLWRRLIVGALDDGASPRHLMPIFTLMASGLAHLEETAATRTRADALVAQAMEAGTHRDGRDLRAALEASFDYAPDLMRLAIPVFAIGFADDALNPSDLGVNEGVARTYSTHVRYAELAAHTGTNGHQTLRDARSWAPLLPRFLAELVS